MQYSYWQYDVPYWHLEYSRPQSSTRTEGVGSRYRRKGRDGVNTEYVLKYKYSILSTYFLSLVPVYRSVRVYTGTGMIPVALQVGTASVPQAGY